MHDGEELENGGEVQEYDGEVQEHEGYEDSVCAENGQDGESRS